MVLTVVATLCHLVTVDPAEPPVMSCFETVAGQVEGSSDKLCGLMQPGLAQWKANSRFADDEYGIERWRCEIGVYEPDGTL
jgi:hypothetical protein